MKLSDFDYYLPRELIAQKPVEPRDSSKLMVLEKDRIEHRTFREILDYLEKGDTLVLNDSRVMPARLSGRKETGGRVRVLLLRRVNGPGKILYECFIQGKNLRPGTTIYFDESLAGVLGEGREGRRTVEFQCDGDFEPCLDKIGDAPLPPYIKERLEDKDRYQTVYAKIKGSIAAPTAGLHFTQELLGRIRDRGVNIAYLTLHVGPGTFTQVRMEDLARHRIEPEYYRITEENASLINNTEGKLVIVGTTTVRALETAWEDGVKAGEGWSDLFIYPPYTFKTPINCLITNFHLPKSTLLMLVSAYAGRERIMRAYREAMENSYRFYSFGDAMLIMGEHV